ncbi:MAG TPA: DNA repair protein RadA [Thermomicrobiales bacterium]|nr:DNA repair protein RadA [Thermomicrobiales bacterium]
MPKTTTHFVCQNCGFTSTKWHGRCPQCEQWESMLETIVERAAPAPLAGNRLDRARPRRPPLVRPTPLGEVSGGGHERLRVPMEEFNRVVGGGLVPGSLVLIGGDPGVGKSTLITEVAAHLAAREGGALYVSAEESAQQLKLRADRLGLPTAGLAVLSETNLDLVLDAVAAEPPGLLVIDSIQTVYSEDLTSAAGSVSQVRGCAERLMRWAKPAQVPVLLVGHVTKEGSLAGPRVLEHMVDAVLYLEGDRFGQYRILRAAKNRFGSTNEVGIFEMSDGGMREIRNPSEAFLQERVDDAAGSTVAVTLEGTRPLLVEVQALTATTQNPMPRRTANGVDTNRLQMLAAVLSKRVGLPLGGQDVFVNVVGGLKVDEPAVDLAVAAAIASSFRDVPIDAGTVMIGEIGLSGELRSVGDLDRRLHEAARLGFTRAIVPATARRGKVAQPDGLAVVRARTLPEAIDRALLGR